MKIAIASGKGGTGKTTVAVNLAVAAQRAGRPVHLCDCDVEEPNAHLFLDYRPVATRPISEPLPVIDPDACVNCGRCGEICAFNAIACLPGRTLVLPELCHGCGGCWRVCEFEAIRPADRMIGEITTGSADGLAFTTGRLEVGELRSSPLIAAVKRTAEAKDFVLLDCPPGTTCPVVEALRDVDYVVLVTEPTPFGLHDLQLAADLVRKLDLPCGVVVNRDVEVGDPVGEFCAHRGIEILARLPFRRGVAEVCAEGGLALDADPDFAAALGSLADRLAQREVSA
jgi:MinD superfamily P-loop ATPase